MTDVTATYLTGTAMYGRKQSDGNYGSYEASIFVQFPYSPEAGDDEIIAAGNAALAQAVALVEARLGKQAEQAVEAAPVRTVDSVKADVKRTFPGTTEVYSDQPTNNAELSDTPPHDPDTRDRDERNANRDWAVATLKADIAAKRNFKTWYDNRLSDGSVAGNRPAFKHKESGVALWLSDVESAGIDVPISKFAKSA